MNPHQSDTAQKAARSVGRCKAMWAAASSLARGIPLLFSRRPGTPLRVFCIAAFDALHRVNCGRKLSARRISEVAAMLDWGACINDVLDDGTCCCDDFEAAQSELRRSGWGDLASEHLKALRAIEANRPDAAGESGNFLRVQTYRESVVRTSLATVTNIAFGKKPDNTTFAETVLPPTIDVDIEILFRLVMLCQVIDDTLDAKSDLARGLPSFITAVEDQTLSLSATSQLATEYATIKPEIATPDSFPFRLMLAPTFWMARLLLIMRKHLVAIPNAGTTDITERSVPVSE